MCCLLQEKKSSTTPPPPALFFFFLPPFICVCFINLGESSVDHFGSLAACSSLKWLNCFCNLRGKGNILKIGLYQSPYSVIHSFLARGQVPIKSHLTRLHQFCPKHWHFPLFLAFQIRKFSWIPILLFPCLWFTTLVCPLSQQHSHCSGHF